MQSTNGFDEIKRLRNVQLASTMAGPSSSCGTTISNPGEYMEFERWMDILFF
jgi:hypothetical protein